MWQKIVGKVIEEVGKHVGGAEDGIRHGIQSRNSRLGRGAGARGGVSPYMNPDGTKKAGFKNESGRKTPNYTPRRQPIAHGGPAIEPSGDIPLDFSRTQGKPAIGPGDIPQIPDLATDTRITNQARNRVTGGWSKGPGWSRSEY